MKKRNQNILKTVIIAGTPELLGPLRYPHPVVKFKLPNWVGDGPPSWEVINFQPVRDNFIKIVSPRLGWGFLR